MMMIRLPVFCDYNVFQLFLLQYKLYSFMKQDCYIKTILRHLESTNRNVYIISNYNKRKLSYPQRNINIQIQLIQPQHYENNPKQLIALDCQMVKTMKGDQLCQVTIINEKHQILYNSKFRPKDEIIDYVNHITGLTKQSFLDQKIKQFGQEDISAIQMIIQNKIIVGHDLANDLKVLPISHYDFIDTIALFPHNLGLPFKNKLKQLSMEYLKRPIQWLNHNPIEDAEATLDITTLCISQGRGITAEVDSLIPQKHYSFEQLLKQAQLQLNLIKGFFLRGSRALGMEIVNEDYISDWDYFCVYNTKTTINGKLIKLYETDITIYDQRSFYKLLEINDIPCVQLFYLPTQCQIINKLHFTPIQLGLIRESLGFHLGKCDRKIKRFNDSLVGPIRQWKLLKAHHLKLRFMIYFMQIFNKGFIFNIMQSTELWKELVDIYKTKGFEYCQQWIKTIIKNQYTQIRKVHSSYRPLKHFSYRPLKHEAQSNQNQTLLIQNKKALSKPHQSNSSKQQPLSSVKLNLIQFLRKNVLQKIQEHNISYRRHAYYPNLIQFHYLKGADFNNPLCRQSRGIILNEFNNYAIVSLPYLKFFDYNDKKYSQLNKFDFNTCKIYQKSDGSIAMLYHYDNKWCVSSSKIPDGENKYCFARPQTTTQFKQQFMKIFTGLKYQMPTQQDKNLTFIFELMSKDHIIVVRRQTSNLVLHGVINRTTGDNLETKIYALKYGWNYAEELPIEIGNIEEAVKLTENMNPLKQQGFILIDKNYLRIKVKSSNYVRANWLAELNLTATKDPQKYILMKIVLEGSSEQFCAYCPQWSPIINQINGKILYLNRRCLEIFDQIKNLEDRKAKSLKIQSYEKYLHPFLYCLCGDYERWKDKVHTAMPAKKLLYYILQLPVQAIN